jgi:hypothetical protein
VSAPAERVASGKREKNESDLSGCLLQSGRSHVEPFNCRGILYSLFVIRFFDCPAVRYATQGDLPTLSAGIISDVRGFRMSVAGLLPICE